MATRLNEGLCVASAVSAGGLTAADAVASAGRESGWADAVVRHRPTCCLARLVHQRLAAARR